MYRALRLLHVLGFGTLLGGLAAVALVGQVDRIGPLLGLAVGLLVLSGIGMLAATRGRALSQGWLRVHLLVAVGIVPALAWMQAQGAGLAVGVAIVVVVAAASLAALKPRFARTAR